jgi:hypothetical protein
VVLEDPLWQDGNDYPARLDRQFIEDVFDVEGVIKPSTGALLVGPRGAGANMSVDVAAGRSTIAGDDEANQGSYRCISTAVENVPIGAAPGSDSRIDLIVARVRDAAVTGGVSSDWIFEAIPGAVAAAPVAPAVPNTAIPLAQVLVTAGDGSITAGMITDRRTAAGNAAYEPKQLIGEVAPAAGTGVVFDAIPQTFRHLQLVATGLRNAAALDIVFARFNDDATTSYRRLRHERDGAGTGSTSYDDAGTSLIVGRWGGAGGVLRLELPEYRGASFKHAQFQSYGRAGSLAAENVSSNGGGTWVKTDPITKLFVSIANGFSAGTRFSLYGMM